jgi:hypothetical protein
MLRSHLALLLNYFKAKKQFSSGVVEGPRPILSIFSSKNEPGESVSDMRVSFL